MPPSGVPFGEGPFGPIHPKEPLQPPQEPTPEGSGVPFGEGPLGEVHAREPLGTLVDRTLTIRGVKGESKSIDVRHLFPPGTSAEDQHAWWNETGDKIAEDIESTGSWVSVESWGWSP